MNKLAYESKEFGKRLTNIDDSRTSDTTAWSSSKITDELNAHTQIDDSSTSTSKTWSSSKINSELPSVITQYQASDKSLSFKKDIATVKDTGDKVIWQAPCINICRRDKKIYKSLNLPKFFDSGISTNLEWKTGGGFGSVFDVNGFYYFIGVVNGNLVVYKTKDFITFESTSVTSSSSLNQYCKFYMYRCCLIIGNKLALFYDNSKFILLDFESETYTVTEVGKELTAQSAPSASFAGRLAYFKGSWYVLKVIGSNTSNYRLALFKSSDNGVTWSRLSIEGTDTFSHSDDYILNVSIQGDELIFITQNNHYCTSDGNTWTSFTSTNSVILDRESLIFYLNDFIFVVTFYDTTGNNGAKLSVTKDFKTSLLTMTVNGTGSSVWFERLQAGMTYFKGKYYLDINDILMYSTDGLTWTEITITRPSRLMSPSGFNFFKSTHLNTFEFVQFNNYLILFRQGEILTINESGQIEKQYTFAYYKNKQSNYCITNNTLVFYHNFIIYYTRDGINWKSAALSSSSDYYFISAIEYKIDCGLA